MLRPSKSARTTRQRLTDRLPGTLFCAVISAAAFILGHLESTLLGHSWIEPLVLAMLLGMAIRAFHKPAPVLEKGIKFCAKTMLEVAIVLLGAALSFASIAAVGPWLVMAIVATVAASLALGYALGRLMGLTPHMAVLIAAGNAICGNSAIAATSAAINAKDEDVATAIAFTGVLGVAVVLLLPLLIPALSLNLGQYGAVVGLTVFSVPQVLAAAAPVSAISTQVGTIVKLIRVLTLGPVVAAVAAIFHAPENGRRRISPRHLLPWYIIGFLIMATLRSFNLIPAEWLPSLATAANWVPILAMAGIGLGVEVRRVAEAGPRTIATVTLSLLVLVALSILVVKILPIPTP